MLNFEEYKDYLINYFIYPCDDNEEKSIERKNLLENRYSDDKLKEIVLNTENFIKVYFEESLKENQEIYSIPLYFENETIFTNCTGGWHPDTLIPISPINEDIKISEYLLKTFLGKDFCIAYRSNPTQIVDELGDDATIVSYTFSPDMIIISKLDKIREKQEELGQCKVNKLVRKLEENI